MSLLSFAPQGPGTHRRRITAPWILTLVALAALPLLLLVLRILALSGHVDTMPVALGDWLNRNLTLLWIGAGDRGAAVTILLLPMAALLTAFTRLTLGLRVLGFRAILIAIGFQEIGVMPSLLLIAIVAGTAILVRPAMRRIGLPLYARVAAILCIVAAILVTGLLAGAWFASGTLWSMAFFPVVILAMLAESIAGTVARENLAMAAWRTVVTIALAGIIALLSQLTPLRELVLATPELILTQLVLIVLLSEFADLRLFEGFTPGRAPSAAGPLVALVRNRAGEEPLRRRGVAAPRRYSSAALQPLINGLRDRGFTVQVLEADSSLPGRLRRLAGRSRQHPLVLNAAGGTQGAGRRAWVANCCEVLGLSYTGPGPQAPALWDDRLAQLDVLRRAGHATPTVLTAEDARRRLASRDATLILRPRFAADHNGRRVTGNSALQRELARMRRQYKDVLIEAGNDGQRISVVLVGKVPGPATDAVLLRRQCGKWTTVAATDATSRSRLLATARRASNALGCGAIARIDMEITPGEEPIVWQVEGLDLPTRDSAIGIAARSLGLDPGGLGCALLADAVDRACASTASSLPATDLRGSTPRQANPPQEENTDALLLSPAS